MARNTVTLEQKKDLLRIDATNETMDAVRLDIMSAQTLETRIDIQKYHASAMRIVFFLTLISAVTIMLVPVFIKDPFSLPAFLTIGGGLFLGSLFSGVLAVRAQRSLCISLEETERINTQLLSQLKKAQEQKEEFSLTARAVVDVTTHVKPPQEQQTNVINFTPPVRVSPLSVAAVFEANTINTSLDLADDIFATIDLTEPRSRKNSTV